MTCSKGQACSEDDGLHGWDCSMSDPVEDMRKMRDAMRRAFDRGPDPEGEEWDR